VVVNTTVDFAAYFSWPSAVQKVGSARLISAFAMSGPKASNPLWAPLIRMDKVKGCFCLAKTTLFVKEKETAECLLVRPRCRTEAKPRVGKGVDSTFIAKKGTQTSNSSSIPNKIAYIGVLTPIT
jgi:hypothetical protein